MAKLRITDLTLRDAQQSLIATRMTTEEMLPILSAMDDIGFYSCEVWGGATFDACIRFLDEDPWDRLRIIREKMPKTKLQMLFRGQSMLGYRHYADDVVEYFIQRSVYNGIDIIRVFDALNDIRNLEQSIKVGRKEGAHVQGAISYTTSPVHNLGYFIAYAKQLESLGVDSICVKDMAGLIKPYDAYDLVAAIKREVGVPVQMHTHYTSGMASMALLKAAEAGADAIDTVMSPLALGSSHAPTESMVATLENTPYDTGLDLAKLYKVRDYFETLRDKYLENGLLNPKVLGVNANIMNYQVPGGMLSNLLSQLEQAGEADKLEAVLEEVPKVRADCGYPPLVTPTSQIIGTQAVVNVLTGQRYTSTSQEFRDLILGKYGKTPGAIDPQFIKEITGGMEPITKRPADYIEPELEKIRAELPEKYNEQPEDVLTLAMFPKVAPTYFKNRSHRLYGVDSKHADEVTQVHPV